MSDTAPLEHRCGYCGKTADRIESCVSGELAIYQCWSCDQKTIVDLTRLPRFTDVRTAPCPRPTV